MALALTLTVLAAQAQAQDIPQGCFIRVYDAAHMASHPEQVVHFVQFQVGDWITEVTRHAAIKVLPRGKTTVIDLRQQVLRCGSESLPTTYCQSQCGTDGALEVIKWDADSLTLGTSRLIVNTGACGGTLDLAEAVGQQTQYRLDRVDDANCQ